MAGVYDAIKIFSLEHRGRGALRYDAQPITDDGYAVWVACSCGARLDQWVSPEDAEVDLLRSTLLTFENQVRSDALVAFVPVLGEAT